MNAIRHGGIERRKEGCNYASLSIALEEGLSSGVLVGSRRYRSVSRPLNLFFRHKLKAKQHKITLLPAVIVVVIISGFLTQPVVDRGLPFPHAMRYFEQDVLQAAHLVGVADLFDDLVEDGAAYGLGGSN